MSGCVNLIGAESPGVLPSAQLNCLLPLTSPRAFVGKIESRLLSGVKRVAIGAEAYPLPPLDRVIKLTPPLVMLTSAVAVTVPAVAPPPLNTSL